ncbi:MAG: hypothetical protein WAX69_12775 [Victivallales bacterium]
MQFALYSVVAIWGVIALVLTFGAIAIAVLGIIMLKKKNIAAGIILSTVGALGILLSFALIGGICYACYFMKDIPGYKEAKIEEFNPDKYPGKLATISFPFKGESILTETDSKKNIETKYSSKDGTFKVPAGMHDFGSYEIRLADAKGGKWEANSWETSYFENTINLAENASLQILAGPPFIAKLSVKEKSDGTVSFSLNYKDKKGNEFSLYPANTKEDAPGFEVFSASGEKLWSGEFKYG